MELTLEQKKYTKELILGFTEDFKPEVAKIEKRLATTKNHYGDYMALISTVAKNKGFAKIVAIALIQAGANKQGVVDALNLCF